MRRFFHFTRVSPQELRRESERRAWISAAVSLLLLLLLAGAASLSHASKLVCAGSRGADVEGVVVNELREESAPPPPPPLREEIDRCLPPPSVEMPIQLPLVLAVEAAPMELREVAWEALAEVVPNPLPEVELPEQLAAPPPPRPVAGSTAAPARAATPGELIPASYRSTPRPPYPADMLNRRLEGRVRLRIALGADGVPQQVQVESSSGYSAFDRCAREWVLAHWRFHPARRQGEAVASVVHTQVEFVLH